MRKSFRKIAALALILVLSFVQFVFAGDLSIDNPILTVEGNPTIQLSPGQTGYITYTLKVSGNANGAQVSYNTYYSIDQNGNVTPSLTEVWNVPRLTGSGSSAEQSVTATVILSNDFNGSSNINLALAQITDAGGPGSNALVFKDGQVPTLTIILMSNTTPADTTPPTITLLGNSVEMVEVGTTYTDAGATADDNYDGDITNRIIIVNNVDTTVVGQYTVTYNVSDNAGNAATEVTRTVNVVDTTPPTITLLGNPVESIEVGSTYTDAGATADDNYDGDITNRIIIVNNVDVTVVGQYTVTYNVSDNAGNAATEVTRTVNVVDTTPPTITLLGNPVESVEVGSTYTDAGATADDNYDGDITNKIIIVNPVNTTVVGQYTVTYNVSDNAGNAATEVTRTVNVVDTTPPTITLLGNPVESVEVGSTYTDAGATADDNYDGDVTNRIIIVNPVNTTVVGQYTVTYNVSDNTGNAATEVTRTVNVVDTTPPTITLLGQSVVTVYVGSQYVDAGATANDNYDGNITNMIVVSSTVDTSSIGTYTVKYNVLDSSGNAATEVMRTVKVVYNFDGFQRPVEANGVNKVKAGSAVPLKFSLNGDYGLDVIKTIRSYSISSSQVVTNFESLIVEEAATAGKSGLQFDNETGIYTYVWKTDKNFNGYRQLVVEFKDGTSQNLIFNFIK